MKRRRATPVVPAIVRGYSLVEVLLVVVILGILAGLMIDAGIRDLRRERVNTVVVELAGWLETVRRDAQRGKSCPVTIQGGSVAGGAVLASSPCRGNHTITPNQPFTVSSTSSSFTFTPAGTLFPAPETPVVIGVRLADGGEPARCVQLEGLLGLISVGRSSGTGSCDTTSRF